MTSPYDFPNTVAIKILVRRDDKILLVREPDFNDWMPNRLGLPGGKPLLNETLQEALKRKIETEVGLVVEIKGLVRIVDIIMPEKTVYHFIVAANYVSGEIGDKETESDDVDWYPGAQIVDMHKDAFTEYYNDRLVNDFLSGSLPIVPLELIAYQDNRSGNILRWMNKGSR